MRVSSPTRLAGSLAIAMASVALATPAHAATPQAPGDYQGLGFDTCRAPDQTTMNAWKSSSPFSAIGIYVSGNSRYCGDAYQTNLTASWVQTNADRGWHFLPIHVGYQSPCFVNNPDSRVQKKHMSSDVGTARSQAQSDANETIAALRRLGFGPGNVSYLDLEYYKRTTACDNVTLEFADAWTETLHSAGYRSGVYSSGSAAIKAIDDAITAHRPGFNVPDHIWIAWTNGVANTDGGSYLHDAYFANHQRIHQYKNGTTETYGGKTLNIDRDAVDVAGGSAPPPPPLPAAVDGAIYRFWSQQFKNAHFYTMNRAEAESINANDRNWLFESIAFKALTASGGSCSAGSPIHRFWSARFTSHFYTANQAEADHIRATDRDWTYEGIAYCAYMSQQSGATPLYRFWSPVYGKHFYTADQAEADHIRAADRAWTYEGIAYYVQP